MRASTRREALGCVDRVDESVRLVKVDDAAAPCLERSPGVRAVPGFEQHLDGGVSEDLGSRHADAGACSRA
jgi:hypothetical protein